jgi:hypothetical protein
MLRSARRICQQGEAEQKEACHSSREEAATTTKAVEQMDSSKELVWDPGGFQQSWEAHEQELMNFSQQWSMMQEHRSNPAMHQLDNTSKHIQWRREAQPSHFQNLN